MLDPLRHVREHLILSRLGHGLNLHHGLAAPAGEFVPLRRPFLVADIRQFPHHLDGRCDVLVRNLDVHAGNVPDRAEAPLDLDRAVVNTL